MKRFGLLLYWVKERQSIFLKKTEGKPPPFTQDPILRTYRFCNVYRENDTVSQWIFDNITDKFNDHEDLWFALVICRLFNLPTTIESIITDDISWDRDKFVTTLHQRRAEGHTTYNSAYMITTHTVRMDKIEYIADLILSPMWLARATLRPTQNNTLEAIFGRLEGCYGMGKFLAAQVIADIKHCTSLQSAPDWWTFAAPGAGSIRGMRRLHGFDVKNSSRDKYWHDDLLELRTRLNEELDDSFPELDAHNTQNVLCEFDKYLRVMLKEGRPKKLYHGG